LVGHHDEMKELLAMTKGDIDKDMKKVGLPSPLCRSKVVTIISNTFWRCLSAL